MLSTLIIYYQDRIVKFSAHDILAISLDLMQELHEEWSQNIPAEVATRDSPVARLHEPKYWITAVRAITPAYSRYYKIGGHLIKCNQEKGPGLYPDYISDCGPLPEHDVQMQKLFPHLLMLIIKIFFIRYSLTPNDSIVKNIIYAINLSLAAISTVAGTHEAFGEDKALSYREFYAGLAVANTVYASLTEDFQIMADQIIAASMRELLSGGVLPLNPVLPSLVATMFLAEAKRNHLAFMTNLMLLDFIEMDIRYGKTHKKYTLRKILWHPSTMDPEVKKYERELDAYQGEFQDKEGGANPDLRGGKSSMASYGSTNGLKQNPGALTIPLIIQRQKEASILIRWLWKILPKQFPNLDVDVETLYGVLQDKPYINTRSIRENYKKLKKAQEKLNSYPSSQSEKKALNKAKQDIKAAIPDKNYLKLYLTCIHIRPTLRRRMQDSMVPAYWRLPTAEVNNMTDKDRELLHCYEYLVDNKDTG